MVEANDATKQIHEDSFEIDEPVVLTPEEEAKDVQIKITSTKQYRRMRREIERELREFNKEVQRYEEELEDARAGDLFLNDCDNYYNDD